MTIRGPILAIDPGNTHSAFVNFRDGKPANFGKQTNEDILGLVGSLANYGTTLVIEMIASYGMPVGAEVFDTCVWIGRFFQEWTNRTMGPAELLFRREVKLHLCGQPRAKDANIRQALIDRYGGKDKAIGKKHSPGPLYGISADVWSALAIAVTYADRQPRGSARSGEILGPVFGESA